MRHVKLRRSQRGVTFIGWLLLLVPLAIVGYAGIRLAPIYLNYMRVVRSMQEVAAESKGDQTTSAQTVSSSLQKHFDVDYIDHPTVKEVDIHREGDHWVAIANYEDVAPLFGNISILVQFDKQVEMK